MVMDYKKDLEDKFENIKEETDVKKKKSDFRQLLRIIRIQNNINERAKTKIPFALYIDNRHFFEELRVKIYRELIEIG